MEKKTFSAFDALKFGWETFKKRPSFLMAVTAFIGLIACVTSAGAHAGGLLKLAEVIIGIFVGMGIVAFALKAEHDVHTADWEDLWHPHSFWPYLGGVLLAAVIIVCGLVLLIVPGLIALSMFAFVKYLIIDRDLGPIEALKESARITKGNRLEVLWLIVLLIAINIVGLCALIVGLLLTIPVSIIAMAHAYRTLEGAAHIHHEHAAHPRA